MSLILFKLYKKNKLLLIFLISSLIISSINLEVQKKFFGKYLFNDDGTSYHGFLRYPPETRIWQEAYEFKNEIGFGIVKDKEFKYHFLPAINLGVIGKLFDLKFFTPNNKVDITGINYFLIIQIIFYYFSVTLFYIKLLKINLDKNVVNICVFFLLFEPTINQYNVSIFGETILFSLLLIIFSILIELPKKNLGYFFFGLLLGLCYLQRSIAMLIIFAPIIVIFFRATDKLILKIFYLSASYILIFLLLGFMNHNRSGIFYFLPTSTKDNLYDYLIPKVIGYEENISQEKASVILNKKKEVFIEINNLKMDSEKDRFEMYNWQKNESIKYLIDNKMSALIVISKASIHSMLLNPTEMIFNRMEGKDYYKSTLHMETIKYRIFYSLIIYTLILAGFIQSIRQKIILPHIIFLVGLSLFSVSSWSGYTRYFVPTFLSLCLYFSIGVNFLGNLIYKKGFYKKC